MPIRGIGLDRSPDDAALHPDYGCDAGCQGGADDVIFPLSSAIISRKGK